MEDFDPEVVAELRYRAKAELRKRTRAVRKAVPRSAIAARSARICAALEQHPALAAARSVALFCPIVERHEVDLRALDGRLRAAGKRIAYPSIDEAREMTFRWVSDLTSLEGGPGSHQRLGFADPGPSSPEAEALDVIVVPALLVDEKGNRLGYGAGYYDRALPRFCPPARAIGVAFQFQLAAEVPTTERDFTLDVVVTDERVIEVAKP